MLSLMILLPLRDWRSELEARPEVYSRIYSWAAGRLRGTRELIIPRTLYFIPYRVHGDRIELLRVYHGRRLYSPRG